jgi:hypothetical protein
LYGRVTWTGGYQAGGDLVIHLSSALHLGSLHLADFPT